MAAVVSLAQQLVLLFFIAWLKQMMDLAFACTRVQCIAATAACFTNTPQYSQGSTQLERAAGHLIYPCTQPRLTVVRCLLLCGDYVRHAGTNRWWPAG
jgi:hypothetical protein